MVKFWRGKDKAGKNAVWSRWHSRIRRGGHGAPGDVTQLGQCHHCSAIELAVSPFYGRSLQRYSLTKGLTAIQNSNMISNSHFLFQFSPDIKRVHILQDMVLDIWSTMASRAAPLCSYRLTKQGKGKKMYTSTVINKLIVLLCFLAVESRGIR